MPRAGLAKCVLEISSEARGVDAARPAFAIRAALVTVATKEKFLGFNISETRNVYAVGSITEFLFVFVTGNDAVGAGAHDVVHKIVAKFATGIGETVGKFGSRGIQQDARGFKSGGVQKKNTAAKFERLFGLAVDHAHAGDFASVGIKDEAVDHAVRTKRHPTGFFRRGERGIQTAEVGAGDATAVANSAVMTSSAAAMHAR